MKGLFNGTCSRCEQFKPRCAIVHFKRVVGTGRPTEWLPDAEILCEDCRKQERGKFRFDESHK